MITTNDPAILGHRIKEACEACHCVLPTPITGGFGSFEDKIDNSFMLFPKVSPVDEHTYIISVWRAGHENLGQENPIHMIMDNDHWTELAKSIMDELNATYIQLCDN